MENKIQIKKINFIKGIRYRKMDEIGDKIYGKRIAIVGNAKSLFDSQYGPEIDIHDFVIRFNKGFITKPISQGSRTDLVILALTLTPEELDSYHAQFIANRSRFYHNKTKYQIPDVERARMVTYLGAQPSTGFIAIDMCIYFDAKQIDLYGFAGNSQPTFYNPEGYITQHNYDKEQGIIKRYEELGIVKNKK